MVVPPVRVVVRNHDRSAIPIGIVRGILKEIDRIDDERLFVGWTGISSVPVLIALSLQETDCRLSAIQNGSKELADVGEYRQWK